MRAEPRRISVVGLMIGIAVIAVLMGFCIAPFWRFSESRRLSMEVWTRLCQLQPTCPRAVDMEDWECARGWLVNAQSNWANSTFMSLEETRRLHADLEAKVDFATLEWIWKRLGETGPGADRYMRDYESQFLQYFPPEEAPSDASRP